MRDALPPRLILFQKVLLHHLKNTQQLFNLGNVIMMCVPSFISFFFFFCIPSYTAPRKDMRASLVFLRKPWLQRGYIQRPAPKRKIGLNPFIFDNRAAKRAGVCGTRTFRVWVSQHARASRWGDPRGGRKQAFTAERALRSLGRGPLSLLPGEGQPLRGSASDPHGVSSNSLPFLRSDSWWMPTTEIQRVPAPKLCLPRSPSFAEQAQENVYHRLPTSIVHLFKMLSKKI